MWPDPTGSCFPLWLMLHGGRGEGDFTAVDTQLYSNRYICFLHSLVFPLVLLATNLTVYIHLILFFIINKILRLLFTKGPKALFSNKNTDENQYKIKANITECGAEKPKIPYTPLRDYCS